MICEIKNNFDFARFGNYHCFHSLHLKHSHSLHATRTNKNERPRGTNCVCKFGKRACQTCFLLLGVIIPEVVRYNWTFILNLHIVTSCRCFFNNLHKPLYIKHATFLTNYYFLRMVIWNWRSLRTRFHDCASSNVLSMRNPNSFHTNITKCHAICTDVECGYAQMYHCCKTANCTFPDFSKAGYNEKKKQEKLSTNSYASINFVSSYSIQFQAESFFRTLFIFIDGKNVVLKFVELRSLGWEWQNSMANKIWYSDL